MGMGYQKTDRNVIDYDLWFGKDWRRGFRGPRSNLASAHDIVCIGAAQTFGRFVERPFSLQLSEILQKTVLNLGVSGSGPDFYLSSPDLMQHLRQAGTVILQAMSGRSVSAGCLETMPNNFGVLRFTDGLESETPYMAQKAYEKLRKERGEEAFQTQVAAVQKRWVELYLELYREIPGRKLLLWLSSEAPGDNVDLTNSPLGTFPHFVTAGMVEALAEAGYEVVECILKDMPAQVLVNDRTGVVEEVFDRKSFPGRPDRLRALNNYYATPELHDLATRKLVAHLLK
ncbi:MAG: DUF6473 family protein [Litorimonas sp.]